MHPIRERERESSMDRRRASWAGGDGEVGECDRDRKVEAGERERERRMEACGVKAKGMYFERVELARKISLEWRREVGAFLAREVLGLEAGRTCSFSSFPDFFF